MMYCWVIGSSEIGTQYRTSHRLIRQRPPGTGETTNPVAMDPTTTRASPTAHLTDDGDARWEGKTKDTPGHLLEG